MMSSLPLTGNLGRTFPHPPEISVVIPTYNRADLLPALLDALSLNVCTQSLTKF